MQFKSLYLAALCVVALGLPVWAHHSHNNYDVAKWTPFEGTVKEVHWLVPHSWIYLEIKDEKGAAATWALEAANPNSIMENGVKREDIKPGDRIKVRCHLLRAAPTVACSGLSRRSTVMPRAATGSSGSGTRFLRQVVSARRLRSSEETGSHGATGKRSCHAGDRASRGMDRATSRSQAVSRSVGL